MAVALRKVYAGKLIYVPGVGWHYWDLIRWRVDSLNKSTQFVLKTLDRAMTISARKAREAALLKGSDKAESDRLKAYADKLKKDAGSCQSAAGIRGVKEIAQSWPEFATEPRALDADPYIINLQNCTLDLRSEECRTHNPADLITKVCNATFEPEEFQDLGLLHG